MGDRFGHEAKAQLSACVLAGDRGVAITPVWNKSNREHDIVGSKPESVREAAEVAIRDLAWTAPFHIDADHIRYETVDKYLRSSDFFTIDVADQIGQPCDFADVKAFTDRHPELTVDIDVPG